MSRPSEQAVTSAKLYGHAVEMRLKSTGEMIQRSRVMCRQQADECSTDWQRRYGRKKFTCRVVDLYER